MCQHEAEIAPNLQQFENLFSEENIQELQKIIGSVEISREIERRRPETIVPEQFPTDLDLGGFEYQAQVEEPPSQIIQPPTLDLSQLEKSILERQILADRTNIPSEIKMPLKEKEQIEMIENAEKVNLFDEDESLNFYQTYEKLEEQHSKLTGRLKTINFNEFVKNESKGKKARMFLDLMVLVGHDKISINQNKPFSELKIELLVQILL